MKKLIRITTVPISLAKLLEGQLAFMKAYYTVIAVSSNASVLKKVGLKEGVHVFNIELTRKITILKDVLALIKMYFFLKKEKPFIVHTHTPKAGTVGILAAWLARVPHRLHTVAGLPLVETTGKKRFVLNFVEKLTYACATKVYPNSKGLKEIIIKNKFTTPKKLKIIANGSSNGINTNYFNPLAIPETHKNNLRQKLGILKNDFIFIFVGRLVGDKGINELVSAFKKLNQFLSGEGLRVCKENNQPIFKCKLILVGPLETNLDPLHKNTLYEIEENPNIIPVGWQTDVRPYLAISHCLTFPSYREGFPNVVMQAGAMNLPSIVTNINGCNEIIEEEKNGWLIPVKDEHAILKAMKNCITNKVIYDKVKTNTRKMIVDRYEQKMVWEAILEEYKALENTTPTLSKEEL